MDRVDRPLPFFVYGTLRPGHGNYDRLLKGRTTRERPAAARGHHLYVRGVPYAVPADRTDLAFLPPPLVGALIEVAPEVYPEVLADLDALEGYHPADPDGSLYQRVRSSMTAQTPIRAGGTSTFPTYHRAWIYVAGAGFDSRTASRVLSGDYEDAAGDLAGRRRSRQG